MYGLVIKISVLFFIAFAIVKGNEEAESEKRCDVDRWLDCYKLLPQEMKEADDYPDEDVLDRSCPEMFKMTQCFESYITDCVQPGDWLFPFYAYNGKFIKELCNKDSTVRANYLQHVACYRQLDSTFKECYSNASDAVQRYRQSGGYIDLNVEDYHKMCLKTDCMGWWNHWSVSLGIFFKNDEGHNVTVNGDQYRAMSTNFFIPELNNHDVQELRFQQDGATCHTARATIDLLKDTFGDRLISRFGPMYWPPRSCDLTPLDYFLWGKVKSLVYADKPHKVLYL
ncbi:hypothetical protein TNCV_854641 [Trichonephila clavipes]|nr:hypothetical protein TNCV_854641 [Trichonephila clavipes]